MTREYSVAILGATGAVGTRLIEQLEQSTIPVKNIKLLLRHVQQVRHFNLKVQTWLLRKQPRKF